ncbi:zinc finger BED domain-containing protein RICESLEEPER 2-like [Cicer arietinum]|uniref:zinc finger BED domain-containing protein RICESLEEPER 2-like n=1 Tax=Cicer arietinum TaxID=3827 RepID=UPI003CC52970
MTDEIPEDRNNRLKSIVWDHFTKVKVDGKEKAKCNYCKKLLGGRARDGTSHLHGHMKICTPRLSTMRHNNGQTFLTAKVLQGKKELGTGIYDAENARKELAHAIILHEYPLSIVEHIDFRRYSASLQPLFQVPCRNTIKKKKEMFKVYEVEKTIILKLLETLPQRVAITSDMWTASNKKRGYIDVTAHYIDENWDLQSQILRFIYVPAPHTSERLCNALVECLMDWNIDTKLFTITLDNCSTNDAMIENIKNKLQLNTLLKDGALLHMRCCAHILNLIVKDGLEVVKDGMERIRDNVAYWTATPKRKEKFEETAK